MNTKTIWLTGLSGAGKSTIAEAFRKKHPEWVLLDGDVLRTGLCSDLKFSKEDRDENIRRAVEVARLFNKEGKNVIAAFITPFEVDRLMVKEKISRSLMVYCSTSLEICEKRDVKGLYKKARNGEIKDFTGISSPFEYPDSADIILNTGSSTIDECLDVLELSLGDI